MEDAQRNSKQFQIALNYADSTLTTFLNYNQQHINGRQLLYQAFTKYFQY